MGSSPGLRKTHAKTGSTIGGHANSVKDWAHPPLPTEVCKANWLYKNRQEFTLQAQRSRRLHRQVREEGGNGDQEKQDEYRYMIIAKVLQIAFKNQNNHLRINISGCF